MAESLVLAASVDSRVLRFLTVTSRLHFEPARTWVYSERLMNDHFGETGISFSFH